MYIRHFLGQFIAQILVYKKVIQFSSSLQIMTIYKMQIYSRSCMLRGIKEISINFQQYENIKLSRSHQRDASGEF